MRSNTDHTNLYRPFLQLVKLGIGTSKDANIPYDVDWDEVKALAEQHGLSAVVLDGIEKNPEQQRPPKVFLLKWIGETIQGYEYRYNQYQRAIAELAGFYNGHGYKMMVLKGYACSIDWPKPEHRPCGDIDIWQFGQHIEADAALAKEKGLDVDTSHHHHTVFYWRDFMVENHYDFINVHHHKSNAEMEQMLKDFAKDDSHSVEVYGEKVYLPSANLHAIFLLKHTMMHFAAEGITLRHLLDWGFFVKAHGKEIDWEWLSTVLDKYNMTILYNVFNAICVEDLGLEQSIFSQLRPNLVLKKRVLNEILSPEYGNELPERIIPRLVFKVRRWRKSAWKHNLCYKDSMWSAFWSGIWNHLLKPSSI